MIKLRKRYNNENNTLHSFAGCVCHASACLCNSVYDPIDYVAASVEEQQQIAVYADDYAWNH